MRNECAREGCGCEAETGGFCSAGCEAATPRAGEGCGCGHAACRAAARKDAGERSIHGNQGEGNREADRRYREKATRFAERTEKR